jgi:hypothetical protein
MRQRIILMDRPQEPPEPPLPRNAFLRGINLSELFGGPDDPIDPPDFTTMAWNVGGSWKVWQNAFTQYMSAFYDQDYEYWEAIWTGKEGEQSGLVDKLLGTRAYEGRRPNIYQEFLDELNNIKQRGRPKQPRKLSPAAARIRDASIAVGENPDWFSNMMDTHRVLDGIKSTNFRWTGTELDDLQAQIDIFADGRRLCYENLVDLVQLIGMRDNDPATEKQAESDTMTMLGEYQNEMNRLVAAYGAAVGSFKIWIYEIFTENATEFFPELFDDKYQVLFGAKAVGGVVVGTASLTASAIAGATAGAVAGGALGTMVVPVLGTGVAALIGALTGMIIGIVGTLATMAAEQDYIDDVIDETLGPAWWKGGAPPDRTKMELIARGVALRNPSEGSSVVDRLAGPEGEVTSNVGMTGISLVGNDITGGIISGAGVAVGMASTAVAAANYYRGRKLPVNEKQRQKVLLGLMLIQQGLSRKRRSQSSQAAQSGPASPAAQSDPAGPADPFENSPWNNLLEQTDDQAQLLAKIPMDVRKKLAAKGIPPTAILSESKKTITLNELRKVVTDTSLRREVINALKDDGAIINPLTDKDFA